MLEAVYGGFPIYQFGIEYDSNLWSRTMANRAGELVCDFIRERSASGLSWEGRQFQGYSEAYMKSFEFQIAGKSSNVDLRLTGDMLADVQVVDIINSMIVIGYPDSYGELPKVINHLIGDTVPERNFLGITKGKLTEIEELIELEYGTPREAVSIDTQQESVIDSILRRFGL